MKPIIYDPRLFIQVWNSLPGSLGDPAVESERFRRELKTPLFAGHERIMLSPFHGSVHDNDNRK